MKIVINFDSKYNGPTGTYGVVDGFTIVVLDEQWKKYGACAIDATKPYIALLKEN